MQNDKKFINIGKKITMFFLILMLPHLLFSKEKVLFGLAGSIYKSDIKVFQEWEGYLENKLKEIDIEMVFTRTYADMIALIASGRVDIAYIGTPSFLKLKDENLARLLASTIGKDGKSYHYAYIITHHDNYHESLLDFEGKVFAFSDTNSKAGALIPSYYLATRGFDLKTFFKKIVYTREHEESIRAVLKGFADGASVNSLVFDHFIENFPEEANNLRIVQKIGPFAISPIVSKQNFSKQHYLSIQNILTQMHLDEEGKAILEKLHLARFDMPSEDTYDNVRIMKEFMEKFNQ